MPPTRRDALKSAGAASLTIAAAGTIARSTAQVAAGASARSVRRRSSIARKSRSSGNVTAVTKGELPTWVAYP